MVPVIKSGGKIKDNRSPKMNPCFQESKQKPNEKKQEILHRSQLQAEFNERTIYYNLRVVCNQRN